MSRSSTAAPGLQAVPYRDNPMAHYRRLADLPAPVLLDSAGAGRFDLVAADPVPGHTLRLPAAPDALAAGRFVAALAALHGRRARCAAPVPGLPFCGGLIGFIGYDAALPAHGLRSRARTGDAPAALVHDYPWALVQDRCRREAWLVARPGTSSGLLRDLLGRLRAPLPRDARVFALGTPFESNLDAAAYRRAFDRVRDYIDAGDCYQVNLAQRFSAPFEGDPLAAYERLRSRGRAPFSVYLPLAPGQVLFSLSPERFLAVEDRRVLTQPIKGTRPRGITPAADAAIAQALRTSAKDRAENLMIVDLLRNDLGRSCRPGSIRVDELFALKSFPAVHHLVSTIRGELAGGSSPVTLLRDSLPGGSITGAPKRRAMEIIHELEPDPRQAYCGTVFYLDDSGRMDSSILIRSFLAQAGRLYCWGGGGLVADSQADEEYAETLAKVGAHLRQLESTQ